MDFDEIFYRLSRAINDLADAAQWPAYGSLYRRENIEWRSYISSAGDELMEYVLNAGTDIYTCLYDLERVYTHKIKRRSRSSNPRRDTIAEAYLLTVRAMLEVLEDVEVSFYG